MLRWNYKMQNKILEIKWFKRLKYGFKGQQENKLTMLVWRMQLTLKATMIIIYGMINFWLIDRRDTRKLQLNIDVILKKMQDSQKQIHLIEKKIRGFVFILLEDTVQKDQIAIFFIESQIMMIALNNKII
jgi:hypothetical protein